MTSNDDLSKDLLAMIEIITTTVEINSREEDFYRRSAQASTREVARVLFLEIADDIRAYRERLEDRRRKLMDALDDLRAAGKNKDSK